MGLRKYIDVEDEYTIARNEVIRSFRLTPSATDDELLRKIHFRRFKETVPAFCVSYLLNTFLTNNDVRFFNEFLWVSEDEEKRRVAFHHFTNQINESGFYSFCYEDDFKSCLALKSDIKKVSKNIFDNNTICLIGSPFHFIFAYKKLRKLGVAVDVVNVRYVSNKIQTHILNNILTSFAYRLIFGKKAYFQIDVEHKKELKDIVLPKKYDVGFHKLGFIISQSLINQFRKGLINDHWGALPLFKGRSTLEYSKLFGANLVATNHLIKPEIDSGAILCFTSLHPKKLKRDIYFGLTDRILRSTALLASDSILDIDNTQGKMFYEMHPWLVSYVESININDRS